MRCWGQIWGWDGAATTGRELGVALTGQYNEHLYCKNWNQLAPIGFYPQIRSEERGKSAVGLLAGLSRFATWESP